VKEIGEIQEVERLHNGFTTRNASVTSYKGTYFLM
jgi:hypothetical protein